MEYEIVSQFLCIFLKFWTQTDQQTELIAIPLPHHLSGESKNLQSGIW